MKLGLLAAAAAVLLVATPALALWADPKWEPYVRMDLPNYGQAAHHHHWKTGEHIPKSWNRGHDANWRKLHLPAPPKGDHWVKDGNEFVLAQSRDGLVIKVTLGR